MFLLLRSVLPTLPIHLPVRVIRHSTSLRFLFRLPQPLFRSFVSNPNLSISSSVSWYTMAASAVAFFLSLRFAFSLSAFPLSYSAVYNESHISSSFDTRRCGSLGFAEDNLTRLCLRLCLMPYPSLSPTDVSGALRDQMPEGMERHQQTADISGLTSVREGRRRMLRMAMKMRRRMGVMRMSVRRM